MRPDSAPLSGVDPVGRSRLGSRDMTLADRDDLFNPPGR